MEKIYTVREVAQILGLNQRTVQRHLINGSLKGAKVGSRWRISQQALDRWIDGLKPEADPVILQESAEYLYAHRGALRSLGEADRKSMGDKLSAITSALGDT